MRTRHYRILLLLIVLCMPLSMLAQRLSRQQYIEKYKDIAIREMKSYGIPASITLAQACLESGDGNSSLATEGNNHFGIKCHDSWAGDKMYHDDDKKGECFRVYKQAEESFTDHSDFLRYRARYASLFDLDPKDYKAWAEGLKKAGYATNPQYAQALIKIIEDFQLYKYDGEIPVTEVASVVPRPSKVKAITKKDIDRFVIVLGREVHKKNGVEYVRAKRNDTYDRIADEFKLTGDKLRKYNDAPTNSTLKEGDIVYIKAKKGKADKYYPIHIAEAGETMLSISQAYAIKLSSLYKLNRMSAGQEPEEGQEMYLHKTMKK